MGLPMSPDMLTITPVGDGEDCLVLPLAEKPWHQRVAEGEQIELVVTYAKSPTDLYVLPKSEVESLTLLQSCLGPECEELTGSELKVGLLVTCQWPGCLEWVRAEVRRIDSLDSIVCLCIDFKRMKIKCHKA